MKKATVGNLMGLLGSVPPCVVDTEGLTRFEERLTIPMRN